LVEGWLWIGWVMGFGWFECFLFFMVVGARNKLRSTLLTLFSHLSNPTPNIYVDLVALSSTRLESSSIIFSLKTIFSRCLGLMLKEPWLEATLANTIFQDVLDGAGF
jgi:hypothetical protein